MTGEICENITGVGLTCTLIILENKALGKGSPSHLICFLDFGSSTTFRSQ